MVCSCCFQPGHNINKCRDQSATTTFEALCLVPMSELVEAIASMSSVHVAFAIAQTPVVQGTASTRRARLEAEMRRINAMLGLGHPVVNPAVDAVVIQLMPTHALYEVSLMQSLQTRIEITRSTVIRFGEHLSRLIIEQIDSQYFRIQDANAALRLLVNGNTHFVTDLINTTLLNSRVVYCEIIAARIFNFVIDYITVRSNTARPAPAPAHVARQYAPIHRKLHIDVSCAPKTSLTKKGTRIKTARIAAGLDEPDEEVLCGVCQDDLTPDTRITAGCGHTFCIVCIEGTAKARGEKSFIPCPICRADVSELKMESAKSRAALKSLLKKL